jgi:2-dehydropantoate 2-reductase
MRIAVMGTGAVGGYFGAKLAAAGHDVGFIARGTHLEALVRFGLTIESFLGDFHIHQTFFTADPAQIGAVDLVLFCVKSYDTTAAVEMIAPLIGDETKILSLQNGVDNPQKISQRWGNKKTLPGVVYSGAAVVRPAVIKHSAGGRIEFGALDTASSEAARCIQRAFVKAEIPCEIIPDIRKAQWRKLLWNAPFCAISSLTRATVRDIVESDSLRQLGIDCMQEVIEAAKIQEVDLEKSLTDETIAFSRSLGDFKPSMLQDLEAGKPLEHEAFNGIIVNLLHETGKTAPINRVFYRTLSYIDQKIRLKLAF